MRRSLSTWEFTVANRLRAVRLDSIRNKILAFALFATLVPSLSTAWISYLQNRRSITAKITEQLRTLSAQAGREMDLWVKERVYDLRVFASSYEVTENIDRMPRARVQALARLNDYLNSVRDRFVDYDELLVLDPRGRVVATSANQAGAVHLPPEWQSEIRADNPVLRLDLIKPNNKAVALADKFTGLHEEDIFGFQYVTWPYVKDALWKIDGRI